ncbi:MULTISPECIES: fimbrial protein [Citrobacter]|uniref:Fimbrial protein n=1 Tax=Citrobacter telavivensis TaxID=2653932 RepID=A0A6L5EDN7_9ENTR|nr:MULTISPECIES: fimbrial protein [Citrobacter]MPQ53597.1 fimbrial protein [Citrobacter telavivensis]QFS71999.1 fimbrial protein [Citrobacter telavivensis]
MTAIILILNRALSYSLRIVIMSVIALSLYGIPIDVHASYTSSCATEHDMNAKPANVTIAVNDSSEYPVGSLVGEAYVDNLESAFTFTGVKCSANGTSTWAYSSNIGQSIGTYSAPEGNLPVYRLPNNFNYGYAMAIGDPNLSYHGLGWASSSTELWSDPGVIYQGALGVKYKIYFVTAQALFPGEHLIQNSNLAYVCLSSSDVRNTGDMCATISSSEFTISVNSGGCDINADTPSTVNLRRINASDLPKKGDVGNNVDFTISLKCNAATTVNMTLTDPNGGDAENGVLYSDKGDGLAENVGVQILSAKDGGQTPQTVHLNETFTVGNASEGQYSIPMAARYYRTSDSEIVGGKVSASVVYELSYQ